MAPLSTFAALALALASFKQLALAAPTGTNSAASPKEARDDSLLGYDSSRVVTHEDTDAISYSFVPHQTEAATIGASLDFTTVENPQPVRGSKGGLDPGPRTEAYDRLNPDKLAPPGTDQYVQIPTQKIQSPCWSYGS